MHHGLGALALVAAIAFAFGERAARVCVGTALIAAAAFFVYVVIWIAP